MLAVFGPEGRAGSRRESAPTVTEEDGHTVAVMVGGYHVRVSVAVEVSDSHLCGPLAHMKITVGRRTKCSAAVAEARLQVSVDREQQILVAVTIEVSDSHAGGGDWKRRTGRGNECGICREARRTGRAFNGEQNQKGETDRKAISKPPPICWSSS